MEDVCGSDPYDPTSFPAPGCFETCDNPADSCLTCDEVCCDTDYDEWCDSALYGLLKGEFEG